ncbi:MAG: TPM domain-containing protein [Pseudomonadota bacterium]
MRRLGFIMVAGAAMALAACNSGEGESGAAEAATPEEGAEADAAEPVEYVKDIGLLEDGMGEELTARLAAFHGESGHDVHIAVILTTDNQDIEERAAEMIGERGISANGALILIAAADENIGIVPAPGVADAMPRDFTDATEAEMARNFDAGDITDGFNGAVDAIIERLSS